MGEDLPGLCFEALAIIREDALSSYDLTGWLNASHETDFNILHDHGSAAWSLVYFASSGRGAGSEDLSNWNSHDLLGGELLLKTQLQPFTHRYAYLPIRPDRVFFGCFQATFRMPCCLGGFKPRRKVCTRVHCACLRHSMPL
jgi:hypothetical protein